MKKQEKINIRKIDEYLELASREKRFPGAFGGEDLIIRRYLTPSEAASFVSDVADSVFVTKEGEVSYHPELRISALNRAVLVYYTNLRETKPDKMDALIFGFSNGIYEMVLDEVNAVQYQGLLTAIDEAIAFKKQYLLHSVSNAADLTLEAIGGLILKAERYLDTLSKQAKQNQQAVEKLQSIDANTLKGFVENIAAMGKPDEKALVSALTECGVSEDQQESNVIPMEGAMDP